MHADHQLLIRSWAKARMQAMLLLDEAGLDVDPARWPPAWWVELDASREERAALAMLALLRRSRFFA